MQGPSTRVNIVDKVHISSRQEGHRERSPQLLTTLKEGRCAKKTLHIQKTRDRADQEREREKGSKSCCLCGDANPKRGRRTQEGSQLPGEEGQHSSGRLWNMPLRVRELELCFKCSPCVSKHWQVGEELQAQNRIRSYEANKKLFSKESGCRLQGKHGN